MKISYNKLFMVLIELRNAADSTRTFSEKDSQHLVDTEDLKGPFEELVKLIKGEEK